MKRIISLLLCILLLLSVLCGCDGKVLPVSIIPREPELQLTGEYPYQLPAIINARWGDDAAAAISEYLVAMTEALMQANAAKTVAYSDYELRPAESGGYYLDVYICSASSGGRIKLTSIEISEQGDVTSPVYFIEDYMTDGDWLDGCLRLISLGINADAPETDGVLQAADICRLLVDYYEAYTGIEVDTSTVHIQSEDDYLLKSLALGLCEAQWEYAGESEVYLIQHSSMLAKLLEHICNDYFGRSSLRISLDDMTDATELFFRFYFDCPVNASPYLPVISGSDIPETEDDEKLSRYEISMLFNAIYEHCFDDLSNGGQFFYDFAPEEMETARYMGFIDDFPSYALASYDFHPCEYQLYSMADYYASTCYWNQWSPSDDVAAANWQTVVSALGWADSYLERFTQPEGGVKAVDNSRNYQWYFSQFNTGEYSDVNCMPTIAAMGIKWYYADSPVTPSALRDLWLPDYDDGWYMSQVADSLAAYDVPYEWHDVSESFTEQLDQGRIILTQMSEAAYDASGHCFVIYGYRQIGDSVQYMVHDPGIYEGTDGLGKPPGEAMLLDGVYVHWIIERMTYSYITIG